jgi:predicted nucleic acid-binding protein
MVIVDTSVWIDFLNGTSTPETAWLDQQLTEQRLGVLDVIACEVLQGVSTEEEAADVLRDLSRFEVFETGGLQLATAAARNYRSLRRQGKTVRRTIDCLIATFCLSGGHALLHSDADFTPFEDHLGLQVIHPPPLA